MDMSEIQKKAKAWDGLLSPIGNLIDDETKKVRHELNRLVYELAEKHGMTVWDVVSMYYPKIEYGEPVFQQNVASVTVTSDVVVRLMPYPPVSEEDADCGHCSGCH